MIQSNKMALMRGVRLGCFLKTSGSRSLMPMSSLKHMRRDSSTASAHETAGRGISRILIGVKGTGFKSSFPVSSLALRFLLTTLCGVCSPSCESSAFDSSSLSSVLWSSFNGEVCSCGSSNTGG